MNGLAPTKAKATKTSSGITTPSQKEIRQEKESTTSKEQKK